ncbi:MAG: mechanosensitive ion channel [Chitinivibrionales bacterium]|nr:mechanosensitive ion channel [Chitinivibrionales bacterium]
MVDYVTTWFQQNGISTSSASLLTRTGIALGSLLLSFIVFYVGKSIIKKVLPRITARTKTTWDDVLVEKRFFRHLAHLAPAIIIYGAVPIVFAGYVQGAKVAQAIAFAYIIFVGVLALDSLLNAFLEIYQSFDVSREIPITGFMQVIKIVVYFLSLLLVISVILDKSPMILVSGLGAMTAVIMLIFKDAILGLVAGIQLISNKMLSRGDWLEMPKYGADGDVVDITLTTVKVKNWDKTISTVPTYALITDSFKNWRGMRESGGRRIMRSLLIDMSTIRFCDEEMLERFAKIRYIADYIESKRREVGDYNQKLNIGIADLVNQRRLTNVGTLRAYITAYLKHHPLIHQNMTFLIRQLDPTEHGLPLQIYVFCKDIVWANYEAAQADIFDHLLAIVPEFDLRIFQRPSGKDIAGIAVPSP